MTGKGKCKILKDIRRKIAEDNDISFITTECRFQGECTGTCPKCEAELRYLEQELKKRQAAGKAIAVAGIAAALVVGSTGCGLNNVTPPAGDVPYYEEIPEADARTGDVPYVEETVGEDAPAGDVPYYEEPTEEELVLMGDIAVVETGEGCDE